MESSKILNLSKRVVIKVGSSLLTNLNGGIRRSVLENIVRDILLLGLTYASWVLTSQSIRKANEYTWFPIVEVAKLFAGIFITIIPAIAI